MQRGGLIWRVERSITGPGFGIKGFIWGDEADNIRGWPNG
jgi:hypothetical protein